MIKSRYLIPKYISEKSRDIHVFLRLIDLVMNNSKSKSDDFINILNPDKCPDLLLPILASYLGYKYDYNETYDRNRIILRSYKDMIKNKGSAIGIKLAIAIAITMMADKSIIDSQDLFDVAYYDKFYRCNNCNYIAYTEFNECPNCGKVNTAVPDNNGSIVATIEYPVYSAKVHDLIEAVRPAGTNCTVYNGTLIEQLENLGISDFISLQSIYLNAGMSEVGGRDSLVGFTPILKESPIGLKYCNDCGKQFKLTEEITSCPYCGSDNFIESNNSNLRLLYRLYNNDKQFNTIVRDILNSIEIGETHNNSDIVGIILNVHINNNDDYVVTTDITYVSTKVYYTYGYYKTQDTKYNPNKTYYKLINGEYIEYDPTTIFNPSELYEHGYILFTGTQFEPGVTYYEKTDDWKIDLLQSFIFGLKPYIKIRDEEDTEDIECFKYSIIDILDKIYTLNTSTLSTIKNKHKDEITYKFIEKDDKYYIEAVEPEYTSGETTIQNYHDYSLISAKITDLSEDKIVIPDVYSDSEEYDFRLGNSSNSDIEYKMESVENPQTESDTVVTAKIADKEEDTSDVIANTDGYYFHMCNACHEYTIQKNYDSVVICPNCGGIETIVDKNSDGGENISQVLNPSILVGSYIIDLYFN